MLRSFNNNIVFFISPSDIKEEHYSTDKIIRIGGLVKENSLNFIKNGEITEFIITDLNKDISVLYEGILPNLFREGQGMVAKGKFNDNNIFIALELLTKHDENYMPKEVVESLKKQGKWHK